VVKNIELVGAFVRFGCHRIFPDINQGLLVYRCLLLVTKCVCALISLTDRLRIELKNS
jgi:hypothetical protein